LRDRQWRLRPKEKQGSAVQVLKREAKVRWLGKVGWRSIEMKGWRERRVLAWAEMMAVHETTLGDGIWWKRRRE
jgi:hypothetical protein